MPDQPDTQQPEPWRPTIWGMACPFDKRGVPVVGNFGRSIRNVVIIPVDTWTRLCREHPSLAGQQFNVGTFE